MPPLRDFPPARIITGVAGAPVPRGNEAGLMLFFFAAGLTGGDVPHARRIRGRILHSFFSGAVALFLLTCPKIKTEMRTNAIRSGGKMAMAIESFCDMIRRQGKSRRGFARFHSLSAAGRIAHAPDTEPHAQVSRMHSLQPACCSEPAVR
jgi:hypothetical protein